MSICRKKKGTTNGLKIVYSKKYWICPLLGHFTAAIDFRIIHDRNENLAGEKVEAGVNAATQKGQKADVTKGSPTSIFRVA